MTAPPPRDLPPLQRFLDARRLSYRAAGEGIGVSHQTVWLACLPFDDPRRRVPSLRVIAAIYEWSDGAVRAADHYPRRLNAAIAA